MVEPAPVVRPAIPTARPAPSFTPVVRNHGPLPPLARSRAARGTDAPRVTEPATQLDHFVLDDATAIEDEDVLDDPTIAHS
jgi:hypothetical protein